MKKLIHKIWTPPFIQGLQLHYPMQSTCFKKLSKKDGKTLWW